MVVVCIVLGVALVVALVWLVLLRLDVQRLAWHLDGLARTDLDQGLTARTYAPGMAGLTRGVTAVVERCRRDTREQAQAEAELRRTLTAVSQDLRTPLASAQAHIQQLANEHPDGQSRLLMVRERLATVALLVGNLTEFSRLREGTTAVARDKVDVCEVLRGALAVSQPEIVARGLTVVADIPDEPALCYGDRDQVDRVVQNLLRNAIERGREYVGIRVDGTAIEIANKADNLRALDTKRMFDYAPTADAHAAQGTGMGLAIAKALVSNMSGLIAATVAGEPGAEWLIIRVTLPPVTTDDRGAERRRRAAAEGALSASSLAIAGWG
ncbi:MAG: HAMP domain-containing histidine kinase [Propionibacteriaceae bacterium]|jgi:signal transduction histidine kinase|nr:HAMP domain-containing histidine kinase [Propionibacteriaceae bacterium]